MISATSSSVQQGHRLDSIARMRPVLDFILGHVNSDQRPYLDVKILGREVKGLLDSGASKTVVGHPGWAILRTLGLPMMKTSSIGQITVANSQSCKIVGLYHVPIQLLDKVRIIEVLVVPDLPHTLILGIDFWVEMGIVPNLRHGCWTFDGGEPSVQVNSVFAQDSLTTEQQSELNAVIGTYFDSVGNKLGCTSLIEHQIITDSEPIKQRYYPVSPAIQKHIDEEVQRMLEEDIIEKSQSAWSSPILLVPKKDKTFRFCVDYRRLNQVTKKDAYPIPFVSAILSKLGNARYLSSLDIKSAYHQVPVAKDAREYTAFTVPGRGLFQFKRMPFGLTNAPATWMRLIDKVLGPELEPYVFVYLDDIIVVTPTFETHIQTLKEIFDRLLKAGLTLSRDKCKFCLDELKYLGYRVDSQGLHVDPDKVSAILNVPSPRNVTEVRQMIGTAAWYSRFIPNFSTVIAPLTNLLRKNTRWNWTDECEHSFQAIKNSLVTAPILSCPDFALPFQVQTDASAFGIGALLSQQHPDGERVICYLSRTLNRHERNYSVTERECLAVLWAVEKLRPYIEGFRFTVVTDHASLLWLNKLKEPTGRLARWAVRLQQFDYDIVHRKGKEHVVPDLLSRSVPQIESDVKIEVAQLECVRDRWYSKMVRSVQEHPLRYSQWRVSDSQLLKHIPTAYPELTGSTDAWKVVVPKDKRVETIRENHDVETAGHAGIYKTYERLKTRYYWPRMADVARYVRNCTVCIACKPQRQAPAGLMGQRPPVTKPFQVISCDLVGPLPRSSGGYTHILTVSDYFSKLALLFPLRKATAVSVKRQIEDNVFLMFGVPEYLICDNGPQFTSRLFTEMCKSYKCKISFNPLYHAQANPVERMHGVLKTMLRAYVSDNQRQWCKLLPKVGCAIRTQRHEATGHTPFFINFGREHVISGDQHDHPLRDDQPLPLNRSDAFEPLFRDVRKRLTLAYQRSKPRYDMRRRPVELSVGDSVWLRNYVLSNAANYFTAKLAPKYVGPFRISKKLSSLRYELQDSNGAPKGEWHVKDLKLDPRDDSDE